MGNILFATSRPEEDELSLEDKLRALVEHHGADECEKTLNCVIGRPPPKGSPNVETELPSSTASAALRNTASQLVNKVKLQGRDRVIMQQEKVKAAILDAAFDAMFAIDKHGIIQLVNKCAVEKFGYEAPADLIGNNISMVVGVKYAKHHDAYLKSYLETGVKHLIGTQREVSARRKDGTEFPVIIGINEISDMDGEPLFVSFLRDITDEKRAKELEEEKRASEERILHQQKIKSAILDASFDAMLAVDQNGIIQLVNKSAVKKFGYNSTEDFVGKNVNMIVGMDHAKHHDSYMKAYLETGIKHLIGTQREVSARRKDGSEFPIVIGIEEVQNSRGEPLFVSFIRDITNEKRAMQLEIEKRTAEELLLNMLPKEIALRLKNDPTHMAEHHDEATILFADIVGFTKMSSTMLPIDLVYLLNDLFSRFDDLVDAYDLNKIKTIGDCYMVTSVPARSDSKKDATIVCHFAFDMIDALKEYNVKHPEKPLNIRVGINEGPVVAGVVGTKRFLYDLWGDAVNLASRMESTSEPGRIQVTKEFVELLPSDEFECELRGKIMVKGKGEMETVFLTKRVGNREAYLVSKTV